ncbi:uncharacterized protein B0I36DRAFT_346894 [Microdochium trichocladiopsis]|uniref:Cytoskeleton-associated protein n=1 Tax=Microdochium trichocladiopsis TaxID=1682393 RepID=A0A9P9BSP5_9PEZI|nr:uncharacterized protein B0I36DRAFT_346894 [Microdochium trichocladiopsis]KAH7035040.1 hypothetical protein B0I36DRAFT_346894 [Microdochium trichocladiopsis]
MGYLSFLRDERLYLLAFGLTAAGFVASLRTILEYYRDQCEIKPQEPKTQYITQDTEDSLKSSTLASLLDHYNYSIRETALKIVAGRAANDRATIDELLWGITLEDYDERAMYLKALVWAIEDNAFQDPLSVLNTPKAYEALVRSLELSLEHSYSDKLDDPLYDEYYLRDSLERRCLMILLQLAKKYTIDKVIEARFVERWLAKQAWGDSVEERRRNYADYVERKKNRLRDLCYLIRASKIGRRALVDAKLITRTRRSKRDKSEAIKVLLEISVDGDEPEGIRVHAGPSEPMPRVVEQSAAEQRLRRRHREAMVLNDGTHSLGRGDIIQREHDSNG